MGLKKVQVGDLVGNALFKEVVRALDESCPTAPGGSEGHCYTGGRPEVHGEIRSHCQKKSGGITPCKFS
jgi:hypothetical protein